MSKGQSAIEQLTKQKEEMIRYSTPFIRKMMQKGTLTAEKVEILSLAIAAKYGFCEMMEVLLTTGKADVNLSDSAKHNTALHFAADSGQLLMVKLLVKFGANITKNKQGKTPLDLSRDKHNSIYEYLFHSSHKLEGKEVELVGDLDLALAHNVESD
jgi:ankyrin repeat protein